jgi:hypothetical protein
MEAPDVDAGSNLPTQVADNEQVRAHSKYPGIEQNTDLPRVPRTSCDRAGVALALYQCAS